MVEILEHFGAVQDGKLLGKGQLIADLRHDNELLVAEIVDQGVLEDADARRGGDALLVR